MKLTKAIILPVASAALVVVAAGAVFAATDPGARSTPNTVVPAAAASPAPAASSAPVAPYLRSVLDPLVAKGTITSSQEQAILNAWVAKRDELRAERKQLRAFLADGVLTADELAQLPADSPFQRLAPLMKNGQLSVSDLRAIGRGILRELRAGGALGKGAGLPGGLSGGAVPSPSASAGG